MRRHRRTITRSRSAATAAAASQSSDEEQVPPAQEQAPPAQEQAPQPMRKAYPEDTFNIELDTQFLKDEADTFQPGNMPVYPTVAHIGVPMINVDTKPPAVNVMDFVRTLWTFPKDKPEWSYAILNMAFQGPTGKAWCMEARYDFFRVINRLAEWLQQQDDWHQLRAKLEKGQALSDDMSTHINLFRPVAMFMGLKADSDQTKLLFIRSLGGFSIDSMRTADGHLKDLSEMFSAARFNCRSFNILARAEALIEKNQEDKPAIATAALARQDIPAEQQRPSKRFRPDYDGAYGVPEQPVICYLCGGVGHMARSCPTRAMPQRRPISRNAPRRYGPRAYGNPRKRMTQTQATPYQNARSVGPAQPTVQQGGRPYIFPYVQAPDPQTTGTRPPPPTSGGQALAAISGPNVLYEEPDRE